MSEEYEHRIRSAVREHRRAAEHFLAELVKVPSDNPPGDCAPHARRAAELLERLGLTVERHPVSGDICEQHGMVSVTNLVVRRRFGEGPVVALNAHGDVVPPGDGWTVDPYGAEVRDGAMYGRGVAVSKSDFATYAFALLALEVAADALAGTVELHFTYDEEVGGELGPRWLLEQGISRPDFAISAGFAYSVVTAHNGCLHLEIEVRGKSAHAAMPDTGHDALEAATDVLKALYREREHLGHIRSQVAGIDAPTLTVGLISGGINTNVVPDKVTFRLDRRIIPEEDPATVETALRRSIEAAVHGRDGISCRVRRVMLAVPLTLVAGADRLANGVQVRASSELGEAVPQRGVPLYTDARHYSSAGVPTVIYGAGPRSLLEANAHGADERLALEDLSKACTVVALSVYDLLRG